MSLAILLDEHLTPIVAEQVKAKNPTIAIESLHSWRAGFFLSKDDGLLLAAAAEDALTLVTYDQQTIPSLLGEMALLGRVTAGSSSSMTRRSHPTTSAPS